MRFVLILALLCPALASAQEKAAGKRTCRFVYLNAPPNAPTKLFLYDGVKSQEVQLPAVGFSPVYEITPGNRTLNLLTAAVAKPEDLPAGAPAGVAAEPMKDLYLIVSSDPSNKVVPLRIQVVDAGEDKFKKGETMWYNLTPFRVGGKLGDQKLDLSPAPSPTSRSITAAPKATNGSYDVEIYYVLPGETKLRPVTLSSWPHDGNSRVIEFIYGGDEHVIPQIVGAKDFREPEKK